MGLSNRDFFWEKSGEPHVLRRREMLAKYGSQIRKLYGHDPYTAVQAVFVCVIQLTVAAFVRDWPLWRILVTAYCIGGICYNNLTAALHECCHHLIFKRPLLNKYFSFIINIPMAIPAAVSFRKYHHEHHSDMGVADVDVDLPTWFEANYVSGVAGKLLYSISYILFYTLRPLLVRPIKPGREEVLNFMVVMAADALVVAMFGWRSLLYLLASVALGGGLHPLAGHLIAEHFTFVEGQETYSYYGSANLLLYNVGYHNEHHDFPQIPGSRLHKLRAIAPEFYDGLAHHTSYTWVLWKFVTDPSLGPWSRIKRRQRDGPLASTMNAPLPNADVMADSATTIDAATAGLQNTSHSMQKAKLAGTPAKQLHVQAHTGLATPELVSSTAEGVDSVASRVKRRRSVGSQQGTPMTTR